MSVFASTCLLLYDNTRSKYSLLRVYALGLVLGLSFNYLAAVSRFCCAKA